MMTDSVNPSMVVNMRKNSHWLPAILTVTCSFFSFTLTATAESLNAQNLKDQPRPALGMVASSRAYQRQSMRLRGVSPYRQSI